MKRREREARARAGMSNLNLSGDRRADKALKELRERGRYKSLWWFVPVLIGVFIFIALRKHLPSLPVAAKKAEVALNIGSV